MPTEKWHAHEGGAVGGDAAQHAESRAADVGAAGLACIGSDAAAWRFRFDGSQKVVVSSGLKAVIRGEYQDRLAYGSRWVPAIAILIPLERADCYAQEVASLKSMNLLGVGPRLMRHGLHHAGEFPGSIRAALAAWEPGGSAKAPGWPSLAPASAQVCVIIEEDVGITLEDALFRGGPIPNALGGEAHPLHLAPGERSLPLRECEVAKILFDIFCQVKTLHDHQVYHRDLRAANVCVRRFGPGPSDIRATLIDFELSCNAFGAIPSTGGQKRCERALYQEVSGGEDPTPLELDLGYLDVLRFEVQTGLSAVGEGRGQFRAYGRAHYGNGRMRAVALEDDILPLAQALGLGTVQDLLDALPCDEARALVPRCGQFGFVDAADRYWLGVNMDYRFATKLRSYAEESYQAYCAQVRAAGGRVACERFGDQSAQLQHEGYAAAIGARNAILQLGYHLEREEEADRAYIVGEFSAAEVETGAEIEHERWLASLRRKGYEWGEAKNHDPQAGKLTHPLFDVGWTDLDEASRDKCRRIVRQYIPYFKALGLAVCSNQRFRETYR